VKEAMVVGGSCGEGTFRNAALLSGDALDRGGV
jgi:hypothetical protein